MHRLDLPFPAVPVALAGRGRRRGMAGGQGARARTLDSLGSCVLFPLARGGGGQVPQGGHGEGRSVRGEAERQRGWSPASARGESLALLPIGGSGAGLEEGLAVPGAHRTVVSTIPPTNRDKPPQPLPFVSISHFVRDDD